MRSVVVTGLVIGILTSLSACGGDSGPQAGSLGGPCLPGNTCGGLLVCRANVCVAATSFDSTVQDSGGTQDSGGGHDGHVADTNSPPVDSTAQDTGGGSQDATQSGDATTSDAGQVACDPFNPICSGGQGCYYTQQGAQCLQTILPDGSTGGQGSNCTYSNDCAPGFTCLTWNGETQGHCQQWCDTNAAAGHTCTSGTCTHPSSWPGTLGVCRP